jgi:hypothetical protein
VQRWSLRLAVPLAALLVIAGYAQALGGIVPMGRKDPLARLLAVGLPDIVTALDGLRKANGAEAIVTTDYASTAWFAFYSAFPVVSVGEDYRWPDAKLAPTAPVALYVAEERRDLHARLAPCYGSIQPIASLERRREGIAIAHYRVWRLSAPKMATCGRMP